MPPEIAIGLIRAVFQFILFLLAAGLIAAAIGGGWRLWRGMPLPPEERRKVHYMGEGEDADRPRTEPFDIPITGKPRRRIDLRR
ncbi:MAG TPA: hypothetical protein VKS60_21400 [Stellaceae bacterium]|nr:hypothetical protein [Stellaceae bacterium]